MNCRLSALRNFIKYDLYCLRITAILSRVPSFTRRGRGITFPWPVHPGVHWKSGSIQVWRLMRYGSTVCLVTGEPGLFLVTAPGNDQVPSSRDTNLHVAILLFLRAQVGLTQVHEFLLGNRKRRLHTGWFVGNWWCHAVLLLPTQLVQSHYCSYSQLSTLIAKSTLALKLIGRLVVATLSLISSEMLK